MLCCYKKPILLQGPIGIFVLLLHVSLADRPALKITIRLCVEKKWSDCRN